jgi:hypothetical protein
VISVIDIVDLIFGIMTDNNNPRAKKIH